MLAHHIPYAATATVAFPDDFIAKFERARAVRGTRFIHLLSPCPPGWKIPSERAIDYARLAVGTRVFPLLEVEGGRWRITVDATRRPLDEYLQGQGRFRKVLEDAGRIELLARAIDERWVEITRRTAPVQRVPS